LENLYNHYINDDKTTNITQQYFKEINEIYEKYDNDYDIEYCPENRNKLIEMNLKAVISIAKKYQGLGLSLEELISAGNYGLVVAWDKFDPSRSKLKDNILSAINGLNDIITYDELIESVKVFLEYGDIKMKFMDRFKPNHVYNKKEVLKWINNSVYNAKFNSVATMWIRAYILIEIDNYSRVVKKPKSEIYRDREKYGSYKKEVTLDIDAPISNDSDTVYGELIKTEDDTISDLDIAEAHDIYKSNLALLLDGVKPRDRSIFLKKFGIGLPRPMLPKEIADQEGLSIARISQICQTVIEQIQINQVKHNVNPDVMFEMVAKFK
jgi:DNA-directed RNA polymerase sigma subunit (sigma70/sigma32)